MHKSERRGSAMFNVNDTYTRGKENDSRRKLQEVRN